MKRLIATVYCLVTVAFLSGCTEAILSRPVYRQIDRGDEALKAGDIKGAQEFYEKALSLNDKFGTPQAHLQLGLLYMDYIGDKEAAAYNFEKFFETGGGSRAETGRAKTRLSRLKNPESQELYGSCWKCQAPASGEVQYRGLTYCEKCAPEVAAAIRASIKDGSKVKPETMIVQGFFALLLSIGAAMGTLNIVSSVFLKSRLDQGTFGATAVGYGISVPLGIFLTSIYARNLPRDESGYISSYSTLDWLIGSWVVGLLIVQTVSIRLGLRYKDGMYVSWPKALVLSATLIPGWFIAMFFVSVAGALGK